MTAKLRGRATTSGVSTRILGALTLVVGLAGCSDVDSMLFGDSGSAPDTASASPVVARPAATPSAVNSAPILASSGQAVTITPVTIEPGSDTGTAVSKTAASLRAQVSGLQSTLVSNAQRYNDLRGSGASAAATYYESRAKITSRLQIGTTRGNPELVAEWNRAQSALDQLAGNINSLNALAGAVASDASTAHYALDQIAATFNVSGAVDEDHRQLRVLQDETNQSIVLIDRLLGDVSADLQRQTAYVANERANLTTLASAIKNGELYGADLSSPMLSTAMASGPRAAYPASSTPLVVIKFDKPDVSYQQILYAALTETLKVRPGAAFSIVAVSPTRGTTSAVQLAQTTAHRHAQDVLRSMTDMGVPAARLAVASQTDPTSTSTEVRVFVR
ncbi:hypothetical protein FHS83_001657 [Rhizomicrobium palustre]|uniref:Uncharacterized protein n=1 Tax=Rhizomicrobium palustre TaxID=189966 RepID=A0A846MYM0_9PROT|nr:hypothetical protein [Rhizomicrobium palustre]NIK88339.1 hypothetical protein [Rhizomicrobium palustre]